MTHPPTGDRILQVASKLFAEKGYANVSVRDICKETGTTPPMIYYYFGSKKGLFDKVARENISMAAFISKLANASSASDPKEALESFVSTYLSSFPERAFDPGLYLRDSATLDKESARMVGEDLEKVRKMALKLVKNLMSEGGFRKTDPELATECLLGMLNRVIFQHIHFAKASDRDSYTKFVTEFFFRAMR
ncbi:MAG TPA: TetR/AcrR family transcriptional regulator [Nitrososphaerales archaeon]|nr:TetR/AcrR family transcriptional regulator [Nitrososphaerales archaeon]